MPLDVSGNDLFNTMAKVVSNGGAIFFDRVPSGTANATAGGTGTSRTSISTTYTVPSPAREILAISGGIAPTASAAADSLFAMIDVQGTSFKRQPQQIIAPIGSVNLSVGAVRNTPQEWFKVCAPVVNGDQYDWGVTPLIANAHNLKAWVDVMYATIPSGDPTIYSQVSSITAFKTAGSNSTGSLTLTAANTLYEVATGLSPETAAVAQENQILSTNIQCSSLSPVQSFTYGQDSPAVISATSGDTQLPQLARYMPLGNRFKVSNPQLNYTSILDVATTNNLTVAHMARYTSF